MSGGQPHTRRFGPPALLARFRQGPLLFGALLLGASGLAPGCTSAPEETPAPVEVAEAVPPPDPAAFSGERAFAHLQALSAIGPRVSGTRGAARARAYLVEQLSEIGVRVEELSLRVPESGGGPQAASALAGEEVVHVIGVLPGRSADTFVLAASYDTRRLADVEFVGANASASGPALVLELVRALSLRERPYTLVIALLDGDRLPATFGTGDGFAGTRAWAAHLAADGSGFDRIRLAVFFQQVADIDLEIARDLRSHHVYREFFWEAAGVLGRGVYFPPDAGVESVAGAHVEMIEAGLPRSVLIADPRYGGSEVPGRYAASGKDTVVRCSPYSLAVVGEVALEALERIARRLERIDRFRAAPLREPLGRDSGQ